MSTFSIVDDTRLCEHIRQAERKLVYIAPGVNQTVAESLSDRLDDLGELSVTVIVDPDPEVCRMGYGDFEALEILQRHANAQQLALRTQPGLRLGVLIADEAVLVYAPTPRLIEAGSTVEEKPNAVILDPSASTVIEQAAGGDASNTLPDQAEIGRAVVTDRVMEDTRADLTAAPPQRFDLARQARVFSSLIRYVELKIKGVKINQLKLKLPSDLLHADADEALLGQLTTDIRPIPADVDFSLNLSLDDHGYPVEDPERAANTVTYSPALLAQEAKQLRDDYLIPLPTYGTVIYNAHKPQFEAEACAYKARLQSYLAQLSEQLLEISGGQINDVTRLIMGRLNGQQPRGMRPRDFPSGIDEDGIEAYVRGEVKQAYLNAFDLEGDVRWRYKSIAPESIAEDSEFLKVVSEQFPDAQRRRLFEQFDAARGTNP